MARYGHLIIENPAHAVLCTHQISEITPSHLAHTFYDTNMQKAKKKKKKQLLTLYHNFEMWGKYETKNIV